MHVVKDELVVGPRRSSLLDTRPAKVADVLAACLGGAFGAAGVHPRRGQSRETTVAGRVTARPVVARESPQAASLAGRSDAYPTRPPDREGL